MTGKQVRKGGEPIREFIVRHVRKHPTDLVAFTAAHFDITPQAVLKHTHHLIDQGELTRGGSKRKPAYALAEFPPITLRYDLTPGLSESDLWERDALPALQQLPKNVLNIWSHAFTEMVNNAVDHSGGGRLTILLERNAADTSLVIRDDGIGIFNKIQRELDLPDPRLAVLELSKGKLTTDPARHSGQGIFFTSRMMDGFAIRSGALQVVRQHREELDFLTERDDIPSGTGIFMWLSNRSSRTTRKVFDAFSSKDGNYRFNRTVVPVSLAKIGAAELISRSQAKRLLARFEQFEIVMLDFVGVETIGQAFADEVFRVYADAHPGIQLLDVHANKQVGEMIARARAGSREGPHHEAAD